MNNNSSSALPRDLDALQARFALRVTSRLSEHAESLPEDVTERLRFARQSALARARAARSAAGAAAPAPRRTWGVAPWWIKLASFAPLVMLLLGLGVIDELHDRSEIAAAAEVDVALLADDLPPDAYQDAGFLEFLKTAQE